MSTTQRADVANSKDNINRLGLYASFAVLEQLWHVILSLEDQDPGGLKS